MVRNAVRKFSLGRASSLWVTGIWVAASSRYDSCTTAPVQPRAKSSRTLAGTVANFYTRCIMALRVTVPAWVRELLERGWYSSHHNLGIDGAESL